MNQPEKKRENGFTDSLDCELIVLEGGGDTTVRPVDPRYREQIERWRQNRLDDRCSIKPEILKRMRQAAERLGVSEGDLLCEGFDLFLQKHRDKLGDLLDPRPPDDAPKPENGLPST